MFEKYIRYFFLFVLMMKVIEVEAQITHQKRPPFNKEPNYYDIRELPGSADKISFKNQVPYIMTYEDSVLNESTTYHCFIRFGKIGDTLLSECINTAMISMYYEKVLVKIDKGAELWKGTTGLNLETFAGIYYSQRGDSTDLYILTTFPWFRKPNKNTSSKLGNRITLIVQNVIKK